MSDVAAAKPAAKPAAAVPEPAVPEASVEAEAQTKATKAKHSHSQSQSQPRKVRFNVGSNYKVLEIIGEGVSACSAAYLHTPVSRSSQLVDDVRHHSYRHMA